MTDFEIVESLKESIVDDCGCSFDEARDILEHALAIQRRDIAELIVLHGNW